MGKVIITATALLLAAAGWLTGQGTAARAHAQNSAATSRPAAKPGMSDAQIEAAIRAKFARSKINADRFTVKVQNGVATIEGHTDVIQHKGVATRLAKTGGATVVINKIEISEASRKRAADRLAQGKLRAQVSKSEK